MLSALSNDIVLEDNNFILTLSASDVDGDAVTFDAAVDGNGAVSVVDDLLTITPVSDFNGDIEVTVTVSDGSLSDSDSFTLTICLIKGFWLIKIVSLVSWAERK